MRRNRFWRPDMPVDAKRPAAQARCFSEIFLFCDGLRTTAPPLVYSCPMNIALDSHLRLREPGLPSAGVERRRVPALGMLALPVFRGDAVEITDPQGLQVAHVAGFNHQGRSITAALGVAENATGERMNDRWMPAPLGA